jgi:hypothetical protein
MNNVSKKNYSKNEHLYTNVKTCQYISPKFLFLYRSMATEGAQNIQTIK